MKNYLLSAFAALISCESCTPERLMFKESQSRYDFDMTVKLVKQTFEKDWEIPYQTNVQSKYVDFGFADMTKATIIPICRPEGGYDIIQHDKFKLIMPLMPLQIAIYEKGNGLTYISRMRASSMSNVMSRTSRKNMKTSGGLIESNLEQLIK